MKKLAFTQTITFFFKGVLNKPSCSTLYMVSQALTKKVATATAAALLLVFWAPGTQAAPFAYITNNGDDTVSVIDTATNMTVGNPIPAGSSGSFGIAITPNGAFAYTTNINGTFVNVIDTATNNFTIGVPVGLNPIGIAITPNGAFAYVANNGDDTVSVIDTATNMTVGNPIPVGFLPYGIAITPDGAFAYIATVDALGNPLRFILSAGQSSEYLQAEPLIAGFEADYIIGDGGYDSDQFIQAIDQTGATAVIPPRCNRQEQREYDKHMYKERHLIEKLVLKLKHFRRIATRYERLLRNYLSMLSLVAAVIWLN